MRTIDAVHLKSMLQEYIKREQAYIDIGNNTSIAIGHSNGLWEAIAQIDEEPTVEPQRIRGRWENADHYDYVQCSLCGYVVTIYDDFDFCPNCGADMRGTK